MDVVSEKLQKVISQTNYFPSIAVRVLCFPRLSLPDLSNAKSNLVTFKALVTLNTLCHITNSFLSIAVRVLCYPRLSLPDLSNAQTHIWSGSRHWSRSTVCSRGNAYWHLVNVYWQCLLSHGESSLADDGVPLVQLVMKAMARRGPCPRKGSN